MSNDKYYDKNKGRALIRRIMPRRPLNRKDKKTELIQIMVAPDEKAAFDAWCAANSTTMSEVIRSAIAPYIVKGVELRQQEIAS